MTNLNKLLLAESTEYEFKSELETKKPKSWLKTVSAFANGTGGKFFFGVDEAAVAVSKKSETRLRNCMATQAIARRSSNRPGRLSMSLSRT